MALAGETLRLVGMAEEVADRFLAEFPDDADRYGARGHEWCIHDNHYLLSWAVADAQIQAAGEDLEARGIMLRQVAWLSTVLAERGYPLERLARDLEIAADVVVERSPVGPAVAARLLAAAAFVRAGR